MTTRPAPQTTSDNGKYIQDATFSAFKSDWSYARSSTAESEQLVWIFSKTVRREEQITASFFVFQNSL